jgi:hypothetical protein
MSQLTELKKQEIICQLQAARCKIEREANRP